MVLSAVGRCPLMALFTCVPEVVKSPSVLAILKATAKMSQGEWCEWDSTLATAQGTVRQTLTRVGTQCPGLWWKKYQLRRSKSESSITLENNHHDSLMIIVCRNKYLSCSSIGRYQNMSHSGILCRTRHYLPRVVMRGLYYALIYPYLSYGNIVWGNT